MLLQRPQKYANDVARRIWGAQWSQNEKEARLAFARSVLAEMFPSTGLPPPGAEGELFFRVQHLAFGSVVASMCAYWVAQMCDVHLYHFWKKLTDGKHLWLRNNGSTMVSQFMDSFAVMTITHFYASGLPIDASQELWPQLWTFIMAGYVFKLVCAALDTVPFYFLVRWLSGYLEIDPSTT